MTEMPLAPLFATTKKKKSTSFCPPTHPFDCPLYTAFFPHFHQLLQNSTHHIGSAADAEAKNETCVAGHRCST